MKLIKNHYSKYNFLRELLTYFHANYPATVNSINSYDMLKIYDFMQGPSSILIDGDEFCCEYSDGSHRIYDIMQLPEVSKVLNWAR